MDDKEMVNENGITSIHFKNSDEDNTSTRYICLRN